MQHSARTCRHCQIVVVPPKWPTRELRLPPAECFGHPAAVKMSISSQCLLSGITKRFLTTTVQSPQPSLSFANDGYPVCINLDNLSTNADSNVTFINSVFLFRLDALALSVIATATWLAGWLAGWVAVCHSRYCIKTTKRI